VEVAVLRPLHHTKENIMTARLTAAGLLVAATLAAAPAAHGSPVHEDPGAGTANGTTVASLLQELRLDYAATHQRVVHNEIVLLLHHPAAAFL
jgi:hypothetical protein